jgi:hypothetical protein
MTLPYMSVTPFGPYGNIVDLMGSVDRGALEEAQLDSIRRRRLWDTAMPGIESLADYYGKTIGGAWEDTPTGRAAQAQVMRNTSNLKSRIRDLMASRGLSGQALETSGLVNAELSGGRALNELPVSQIPAATRFMSGTLPGLTQLTQPRFKNVQTGALQYLGQVLPYNLSLEGMHDKYSYLLGQGQGMGRTYGGNKTGDIADLFNVGRN